MTTSDVEEVYSCYAKNEHGSDDRSIVIGDEREYNEAKIQLMNEDDTIQLAPLRPPTVAEGNDVTHTHTGDAEYAVIHRTRRDLENVALSSSQYMPSCDDINDCFGNAATESTVHLEQPSNENGISVETGPDVRRCQSKEHLYTTDNENDNGISMQNQVMNPEAPNAESQKRSTNELVYADVDIEHLEKFRVRILACNDDESTEYSDIVFGAPCSVKPDSSNENV
ncbi:hypothetical protein MAR_021258 [Mya arenaria]|uniref:Uncharacterized protein n=1 Tax=Mya arenaria TaxID=6604 RepID=A0ABY7E9T2_MYAAR|nr:hypothetical protein MAR_021258 [Mya arenaria]